MLVWKIWLFVCWILKPSVGICFLLRTSPWCVVCLAFITEHVKHPNSPIRLVPQTDKTMSTHTFHRSAAEGGSIEFWHAQLCVERRVCMQIHVHVPSANLDSSWEVHSYSYHYLLVALLLFVPVSTFLWLEEHQSHNHQCLLVSTVEVFAYCGVIFWTNFECWIPLQLTQCKLGQKSITHCYKLKFYIKF